MVIQRMRPGFGIIDIMGQETFTPVILHLDVSTLCRHSNILHPVEPAREAKVDKGSAVWT